MESIHDMRCDIIEQKGAIEEAIKTSMSDEIKKNMLKEVNYMLSSFNTRDREAILDMKADALDELRKLSKIEDNLFNFMKKLSEGEVSNCQMDDINSMLSNMQEDLKIENTYTLDVGIKKADNVSDAVYLKN